MEFLLLLFCPSGAHPTVLRAYNWLRDCEAITHLDEKDTLQIQLTQFPESGQNSDHADAPAESGGPG